MAEIAAPSPDDELQNQPATEANELQSQPAAEASDGDAASTPVIEGAASEAAAVEPETAAAAEAIETAPAEPAAPSLEPASPAPEAELEPEPEPEPVATAPIAPPEPIETSITEPDVTSEPTIASTIDVPASATAGADGDGGGEWALLQEKVGAWLSSGQLQQQWRAARQPLSLLAGLIALLLVLRIYGALLGVLDSLPLIPGLLELVGVIVVVRFSLTRLVRSDERSSLIQGLQQRWKAFRGKG
jgi:CAAD domains of cyanobacterial aminoacyl-tRNA synthetase